MPRIAFFVSADKHAVMIFGILIENPHIYESIDYVRINTPAVSEIHEHAVSAVVFLRQFYIRVFSPNRNVLHESISVQLMHCFLKGFTEIFHYKSYRMTAGLLIV